jgi:uncharacterized protein YjiS (DUF1127 family)
LKEKEIMSAHQLPIPVARFDEVEVALAARKMRTMLVYEMVKALGARLKAWNDRRRTAVELEQLDDRILADIGVNRGEIGQIAAGHYVREAGYFVPTVASKVDAANAVERGLHATARAA